MKTFFSNTLTTRTVASKRLKQSVLQTLNAIGKEISQFAQTSQQSLIAEQISANGTLRIWSALMLQLNQSHAHHSQMQDHAHQTDVYSTQAHNFVKRSPQLDQSHVPLSLKPQLAHRPAFGTNQ